jgi:hypothetical protein
VNADPHFRWKAVRGDETYALDWQIDATARVWEIGGYEGRWAAQMIEKYDPFMTIFEPQSWAVEKLRARFRDFEKVDIYPYGLWTHTTRLPMMRAGTDGATVMYPEADWQEVGEFRDIYESNQQVEVCLMNIEGAEWVLLPYMLGMNLMRNFRYFWCQFHPGLVNDAQARYEQIERAMKRTHRKIWSFYPSAVAWERK